MAPINTLTKIQKTNVKEQSFKVVDVSLMFIYAYCVRLTFIIFIAFLFCVQAYAYKRTANRRNYLQIGQSYYIRTIIEEVKPISFNGPTKLFTMVYDSIEKRGIQAKLHLSHGSLDAKFDHKLFKSDELQLKEDMCILIFEFKERLLIVTFNNSEAKSLLAFVKKTRSFIQNSNNKDSFQESITTHMIAKELETTEMELELDLERDWVAHQGDFPVYLFSFKEKGSVPYLIIDIPVYVRVFNHKDKKLEIQSTKLYFDKVNIQRLAKTLEVMPL